MAEYRHSAHATLDLKYHGDLDHEIPVQDPARTDSRACARPDPAGVPGTRRGNRTRSSIAGPYPYAVVGATAPGASEAGAIYQGSIIAKIAGRVSGVAKAVLGPAPVGAGVLLRDSGRGGRADDQSVHREPKVG